MQRSLATGLISAVLVLSSLPLIGQDAQPTSPSTAPASPRRPMPKPTNLQVLPKDIAVPDLMALMRGYSKALGVECEFCHAQDPQTHRPNFASDAKPDKAIARTMISMTQTINQKYLSTVKDPDATPADKTVTCGTCHRGNSMPAPFGAPAGGGMQH
jgi:Photosynthetic reaction centre cytochrome C subunit